MAECTAEHSHLFASTKQFVGSKGEEGKEGTDGSKFARSDDGSAQKYRM